MHDKAYPLPVKHYFASLIYALCFLTGNYNYAQITASSANLPVEIIGTKQGLSQGYVPSMLQDAEGFMWFATKDGLHKFDGYHMKIYPSHTNNNKFDLPDNDIAYIAEDSLSRIWVATVSKGLFVFDKILERFHPVKLPNDCGNAFGFIQCTGDNLFAINPNDWAVYNTSTLTAQLEEGHDTLMINKITCYHTSTKPDDLPLNKGWFAIRMMPNKSIWMGRKDTLYIFKKTPNATWQAEFIPASQVGMLNQEIYHFFSIGLGDTMAFISNARLTLYDQRKCQLLYTLDFSKTKLSRENFYYSYPEKIDAQHILFCDNKSWYVFNPQSKQYQGIRSTGGDFSGKSRILSRDGYLWVGSAGNGIYKFNFRSTLFQTDKPDCFGFEKDALDNVYIKFRDGTYNYNEKTKERTSAFPKSLHQVGITQVWFWKTDPMGNIWFGALSNTKKYKDTGEPLTLYLQFNPITQKVICHDTLFRRDIYFSPSGSPAFFIDSKNQIWQRSHASQQIRFFVNDCVDGKLQAIYTFPNKFIEQFNVSNFQCHVEDALGNHWFGTNEGLYCLDTRNNTWTMWRQDARNPNSIAANNISCLMLDKKDQSVLWIGTSSRGFDRLDTKLRVCQHHSITDGLPNNVVNSILQDANHRIWVSSNRGLSCYNHSGRHLINYSQDDGLAGDEFNTGQGLRTEHGTLYFGGVDGITFFDPETLYQHPPANCKVVFTNLTLVNSSMNCNQNHPINKSSMTFAKEILVPYEKNIIRIEFALLQYTSPEKKSYRYFLKGYTKTWINNGTSNSVAFTNLNPGKYQLFIQGCNSNGIWSPHIASISIVISTPWYKSWWFYLGIAALFVSLLYTWYRYRMRQALKMMTMRNVIASDLHDEIGSTISSISLYGDILEQKSKDEDMKQIAAQISSSARDILIAMSDIVWSINPKNDRFDNTVVRMKAYANEIFVAQGSTLSFHVDEKLMHVHLNMNQRKNFYLIFREALNNLIKHANANHVDIELTLKQQLVTLLIVDNGRGFDVHEQKGGNGLHNMSTRSKELHGSIQISSKPGKGTRIELQFPLRTDTAF